MATVTEHDPALAGALACARLGVRVFPVWGATPGACECKMKTTCENPGKHPIEGGWQESATINERRIANWARLYKSCNWGAIGDDVVIVDVDPRSGGSLSDLPSWLPKTNWVVATGGGGWHLGYTPGGRAVAGAKLGPGLDLKAHGGYVVAPGSRHVSGLRYRIVSLPGQVSRFVPWPEEAESAAPELAPGAIHSKLAALLADPPQHRGDKGGREDWLAKVAGHYALAFPKYRDAFEWHVHEAAGLILAQPLPADRIAHTLDSIWNREQGKEAAWDAWTPMDLSGIVENPPPEPERFGPGAILYRGEVHWLAGEPESGKSVLVYAAAVDEMKADHPVLLLDEDAGVRDAAAKLAALGATGDMLRRLLIYLPPGGRNLFRDFTRLESLVMDRTPSFAIVDAAADHLAAADKDEDRARDVTSFINRVLKPLAHRHEIAVAVIDHKAKASPEDRYGRGSGSKLAKTDVGYNVSAPEPFSRSRSGRLMVVCTKDKPGYIGRDTSWVVYVDVAGAGASIRLRINEPLSPDETRAMLAAARKKAPDPDAGPTPGTVTDEALVTLQSSIVALTLEEINAKLRKPVGRTRLSRVMNDLKRQGLAVDEQGSRRSEKRWRAT